MNRRRTLANASTFEKYKKSTRRERFLAEVEQVVPWKELNALIDPFYPKAGKGRPPVGLERMLGIHFLQGWFNLSDPAAEEALYDMESMRRFVGIDLLRKGLPEGLVATNRLWITVDMARVDLDLFWLEHLDDAPPERLSSLCRQLLEGFSLPNAPEFDDWLRNARYRWSGRIRSAFIELARRRMEAGVWEAALYPLNLVAAGDEIDEEERIA